MAKDLKLVAVLEDRITAGLKAASQDWKRQFEANAATGVKTTEEANRKIVASLDKAEKERILLQQKTASIEEQMQAKRVQESNKMNMQLARAEYDLSRAVADQTVERFERLRLIEDAGHRLRLVKTGENNRLIELEMERHEAKLKAIELQEVDFPNKPFEKLLRGIGGLTGFRGGKEFSEKKEALGGILGAEESAGSGAGGMAMGGMAAGIGVAAVAVVGLGIAMEHTVEAAKELRKAEEGLESSFRTSGREETMSVDQLNKYAAALSNTTKFSEEQADAALAMIIPFRHISNEEIPQVLKMASELSAKMGIDLPEAAGKLGMAFENPAKAAKMLKAAHVVLSDAETEQLKLWHKMGEDGKAHELLFKKLSESLGTYAEDTVHSTEIVGNQWHKLEGQMGQSFLHMGDAIAKGILKLEEWKKHLGEEPDNNTFKDDSDEIATKLKIAKEKAGKIKEDPIETEARKKAAEKVEKEIAVAKAKSADSEFIKRRQEEQVRYEAQQEASLGSAREDEGIEKLHRINLAKIHEDETNKSLNLEVEAHNKELESQRAHKEKELKLTESWDKKMNAQRNKAEDDLHLAKEKDPIEQLKYRQERELELIFDFQARQDTKELQSIQLREAIDKRDQQIYQAKAGYIAGYLNSFSQMVSIIGGKSKAVFAIEKAAALATIGVQTQAAVVADGAAPLGSMMWKIPWDYANGAAAAAVVMASTIKGFESGGYTGSGGRSDVAGIVHRGEMVWSQDDVRRAGGPQAADRIRTGNQSSTVHAPITINISGNADDRTVRAIGETIEQKLKAHAWMTKEVAYRNITS